MTTSPPYWGLPPPPPPPPLPPPPPPPLLLQAAPSSAVTTRNTAERRMERMASLPLSAGMTDVSQCETWCCLVDRLTPPCLLRQALAHWTPLGESFSESALHALRARLPIPQLRAGSHCLIEHKPSWPKRGIMHA